MIYNGSSKEELWEFLFADADPLLLEKFRAYLLANPSILKTFSAYAHQAIRSGRKKYSAWVIVNVMRWEHEIVAKGDPFKISNDYIGLLARMFAWHNPTLLHFFDYKPMKPKRAVISGELRREEVDDV